jgi:hypothetical protein
MNATIPQPKHGRRLAFNGIALTKARNPKDSIKALSEVRDELERMLIESRFFELAAFSWVGISIRYGMKNDAKPHFGAICKKDGELPLAIEIETARMQGAELVDLKNQFKTAALKALISAAERYECPAAELITELSYLQPTPDSPSSNPRG